MLVCHAPLSETLAKENTKGDAFCEGMSKTYCASMTKEVFGPFFKSRVGRLFLLAPADHAVSL